MRDNSYIPDSSTVFEKKDKKGTKKHNPSEIDPLQRHVLQQDIKNITDSTPNKNYHIVFNYALNDKEAQYFVNEIITKLYSIGYTNMEKEEAVFNISGSRLFIKLFKQDSFLRVVALPHIK